MKWVPMRTSHVFCSLIMRFTLQRDVFVTARPLDPVTDRNAYSIDPGRTFNDSQVDCVDCSWCGNPADSYVQ